MRTSIALLRRRVVPLLVVAAGCTGSPPTEGGPRPPPDDDSAVVRAREVIEARPDLLLATADQAFVARSVVTDDDGAEHVRFDRTHRGLPVIGGDVVVHGDGGGGGGEPDEESVTHTVGSVIDVDVVPSIGPDEAIELARRSPHVPAGALLEAVELPVLSVYAREEPPRLAWDVLLEGFRADEVPSRLHVIVDAHAGDTPEAWDEVTTENGIGHTLFSGSVTLATSRGGGGFVLRDPLRGGLRTNDAAGTQTLGAIFRDADNSWGDGTPGNPQTMGADVFFGLEASWDYYVTEHGRRGHWNDGRGILSAANFGRNMMNAFFNPQCDCVVFGSPVGSARGMRVLPFVSLDVVGHEFSHGVTWRSAGLLYSRESGGLNESTSDIFGTMVEYFAARPSDPPDYTLGENFLDGGLRSMSYPESDGQSFGCYHPYVGFADVHHSSGVGNHFYYLLAEGSGRGTHTCGTGLFVIGIGRRSAGRIWYRALTRYMTSSTSYLGARRATLRAAADLFGARSAEAATVDLAWRAVLVPYTGVSSPYGGFFFVDPSIVFGAPAVAGESERPDCPGGNACVTCLSDTCGAETAACFGPDWQTGLYTGPCAGYMDCLCSCTDTAASCGARCFPGSTPECRTCLASTLAPCSASCGTSCSSL